MNKYGILSILVVLLALTSASYGVLVTNGSTTLFSDNFENNIAAPTPYSYEDQLNDPANHPKTDSDPDNAAIGSWNVVSDGSDGVCLQVTTATTATGYDPGANEGSAYLRFVRGSGAAAFPTFGLQTSGTLHAEWMANIATDLATSLVVGFSNNAHNEGWDGASGWIRNLSGGAIQSFAGGWQTIPGISYQLGTWQKWELDYVIGASTSTLTIDGVSASIPNKAALSASMLVLKGGATGGKAYVDAVPEPATLSLLALGGLALLKRKR